jgi:hypothetical protein
MAKYSCDTTDNNDGVLEIWNVSAVDVVRSGK